jgi:hypothetical protein
MIANDRRAARGCAQPKLAVHRYREILGWDAKTGRGCNLI